jgi:hypothetical protein
MKRFITIFSLGLGISLALARGAIAQETINADGSSGAAHSGTNPAVNANGPDVVYGDVDVGPGNNVIGVPTGTNVVGAPPGTNITASNGNASALGPGNASAAPGTVNGGVSGTALLGPDGTYSVSDSPPSDVNVGDSGTYAPAPEPAPEPVVEDTTAAPVDTAVASDSADLDGDNYPDAQELAVGLDPNNVDTDGDGVADGDEVNIYGTDPLVWDTDGDGVSDGDELYNTRTDPLIWDEPTSEVAQGSDEGAAATDLSTEEAAPAETAPVEAAPADTGADSDGDRLSDADEAALGTDPTNPDTDGDGYYDGDEAALGSDPFDPASVPATST